MLNTINMNDYYHECLYSFHSFAGVDIVKSVPLEELDHKVVVELMNNRQVLSDLADDRPQYECVILCRAVQCGAILADLFGKNVNSLKDQDVIHNIIDDPELYSANVVQDIMGMSAETFYLDFCGALYQLWTNTKRDGLEQSDSLLCGGMAAYQLGVSMVLKNLGY